MKKNNDVQIRDMRLTSCISYFYYKKYAGDFMIGSNDIQKAIISAVDKRFERCFKKVNCTYYIDGKITAVTNGKYTIENGNSVYTNVPPRTGASYSIGDVVQICVKNGDSSRKFVDDYKLV